MARGSVKKFLLVLREPFHGYDAVFGEVSDSPTTAGFEYVFNAWLVELEDFGVRVKVGYAEGPFTLVQVRAETVEARVFDEAMSARVGKKLEELAARDGKSE